MKDNYIGEGILSVRDTEFEPLQKKQFKQRKLANSWYIEWKNNNGVINGIRLDAVMQVHLFLELMGEAGYKERK